MGSVLSNHLAHSALIEFLAGVGIFYLLWALVQMLRMCWRLMR